MLKNICSALIGGVIVGALTACATPPTIATCQRQDINAPGIFYHRDFGRHIINGMHVPCIERMRDARTGEPVWVVHVMSKSGQLESMEVHTWEHQ